MRDRVRPRAAQADLAAVAGRHSVGRGLPTDLACQFHRWGWNLTLDRFVLVAEGDDVGPNPFELF